MGRENFRIPFHIGKVTGRSSGGGGACQLTSSLLNFHGAWKVALHICPYCSAITRNKQVNIISVKRLTLGK